MSDRRKRVEFDLRKLFRKVPEAGSVPDPDEIVGHARRAGTAGAPAGTKPPAGDGQSVRPPDSRRMKDVPGDDQPAP